MQSSQPMLFSAEDRSRFRNLFQEAATLTVTIQSGPPEPHLHIQHPGAGRLHRLSLALGVGVVLPSRDYAHFEITGVSACLRFLRIVGDDPPFEGEMLRKFHVWKEMVEYFERNRSPSVQEIHPFLARIGR